MSNIAKQLRGQVRQVVTELLPSLLTEAFKSAIFEKIQRDITIRLTAIENSVKETMHEMNERNKDVQSYLVRSLSTPLPTPGVSPETLAELAPAPADPVAEEAPAAAVEPEQV